MLKQISVLIITMVMISAITLTAFLGLNSNAQATLIPTDDKSLTAIQNLIARGKIIAPFDAEYGLVSSIKNKKLASTTIDLIILIANQFDSIELTSIYRPYTGGWPAHSNGEAIDMTSVTYQGVQYTHLQAIKSENQVAMGVWVYVANILRESGSVISVITALDLADKFSKISGFSRSQITGTTTNISVLTTENESNQTTRHEDHMHIEVSPNKSVNGKIDSPNPKVNGQGTSPDINGASNPNPTPVSSPISSSTSNQYTDNLECKSTLGLNYRFGTTSNQIKQLQNCLTALGLFSFPAGSTGYYGNVTTASYNQWLLRADNCPVLKKVSWSQGERSPRVEALQRCLRTANLFDYPSITGFFGPITNNGYNRWLKI
ncbi:MAG: hypothetical protein H7230_02475 [Candidatus Parcubacteria bacterium]|nr:hypothetical protein [Candidatus Paceibacterota bacterium]